jgi:aminoglycoside phosphotransferase (APT) family kinase protein
MNIAASLEGTVVSYDQLRQLLQQTFGTQVELSHLRIGNRYPDYLVLLLRLRHPSLQVVVKLAGPTAPLACPFDRTAMLHRLVSARTGIPMPEVLAVDVSYRTWPWRYFIKTHIPGHEWATVQRRMSPADLAAAYGLMGNAVAQLHAIHFPTFGELAVDGSVSGERSYRTALAERASRSIQGGRWRERFLSVLEERKDLFVEARQPGLCHEDLHKYNIIFHHRGGHWQLATILDSDKAWAGYHESDLARLELWRGMVSAEFWPPYAAVCPIDPLYPQRRPIYQLLWCLEFARSTPEHLADTQRLCAELGLPKLERFD